MTDEEEDRLRKIIHREVQARLLKVPFNLEEAEFCQDMRWHYPRAYRRIQNGVLEEFNCTIERMNQLKNERLGG
jgi:hypothetical protein